MIYGICRLFTENSARKRLIDRIGQNPELAANSDFKLSFSDEKSPYRGCKLIGLLMGLGVGFVICSTLITTAINGDVRASDVSRYSMFAIGCILLCGSAGMLIGMVVERALLRHDKKE